MSLRPYRLLTCALVLLAGWTFGQSLSPLGPSLALSVPEGVGVLPKQEQTWSFFRPVPVPQVYRPGFLNEDEGVWRPSVLADLPAALSPEEIAVLEAGTEEAVALPGLQELGDAEITGEIFDFATIQPLGDVSVTVKGRLESDLTKPDGTFKITGLPAGTFTLEFSKLGYSIGTASSITRPGFPGTIRLGLRVKLAEGEESEVLLDEEPVIGEITEQSDGGFAVEFGTDSTLTPTITSEQFSEQGISDAGDAISKISGANIVGGQFAVVRGLGDRYSNTTLNGALVPSADPARKAVQLDLFPADLLGSVQIYKSGRPDLPAEFTGGLVELKTLGIPEKGSIELSIGTKYRSALDEVDTFLTPVEGGLDFFANNGIDDLRRFHRGENPFFPPRRGSRRFPPNQVASSFVQDVVPLGVRRGSPDQLLPNYSLYIGDRIDLPGKSELGLVFSFTQEESQNYSRRFRSRASTISGGVTLNEADSAVPGSLDVSLRDPVAGRAFGVGRTLSANEDRFSTSAEWGALIGTTWKLNDNHKIGYTFFRNRSGEHEVVETSDLFRVTSEIDQTEVLSGSATRDGIHTVDEFSRTQDSLFRDLQIQQLSGSHVINLDQLDERKLSVDWIASSTRASESRPRTSLLLLRQFTPIDGSSAPFLSTHEISGTPTSSRVDSTITEEAGSVFNTYVNFDLLRESGIEPSDDRFLTLKAGAGQFDRQRANSGVSLGLNVPSERTPEAGIEPARQFINQSLPVNGSREGGFSVINNSFSNVTLNADGGNQLSHGYVGLEGKRAGWYFIGGARWERERRFYNVNVPGNASAIRNGALATGEQDNSGWFPSLQLIKDFGQEKAHQVDFSYFKSIARPIFSEFAPVESFDPVSGDVLVGNPLLSDSLADNYNFRYSWVPDSSKSFGLNLFYKEISDPIIQVDGNQSNRLTFQNFPSAELKGAELEFSRNWDNGFFLTANGSFIKAEIEPLDFQLVSGGVQRFEVDSLLGQADFLANLILGYKNPDTGLAVSLIYNFTDAYTFRAVNQATDDPLRNSRPGNVIRTPVHTLDLVLSRQFSLFDQKDAKLSLKVENLLDSEITFEYEGTDVSPFESFKPGQVYSLSFALDF